MNKIISVATAVVILSLTTACSFLSDDSNLHNANDINPPEATAALTPTSKNSGGPTAIMQLSSTRENAAKSKSPKRSAPGINANMNSRSEEQRWCHAWALDNLEPHVYAEFAKLDPANMDDIDQTVWRARLNGSIPTGWHSAVGLPTFVTQYSSSHLNDAETLEDFNGNCWMYWSEPLNKTNADRRNLQYEAECKRRLLKGVDPEWAKMADAAILGKDTAAYEIPNRYVKILKWVNAPSEELLQMGAKPHEIMMRIRDREYAYDTGIPTKKRTTELAELDGDDFNTEWWGILEPTLFHRGSRPADACRFYYPQLFYGYWVPFAEPYHEPQDELSKDKLAEIERVVTGHLYLPTPLQ